MWIVELALRRRYTFIVVALLIFIIGPLSVLRTPTDIFPNIDIPVLSIVWSFNGFSAEDMAHRVTSPVERALTTDVDNIEHIESQTLNGVAVIKVFFHPGADINRAIAEAAANSSSLLRNLPPGILPPLILSYNASTVPILQLALSSKTLPEQELYDYGNNFIRTQLATVQGAAVPLPFGGKVRQIMVDIDSRALQARGLSPLDVVNAVNAQNLILPGGTAKIGSLEYNVNLNGSTPTVEALNDLPVSTSGGQVIYVRDVAHVRDGYAPQTNIVRTNGTRSALLQIEKSGNASTLAIIAQGQGDAAADRGGAAEGARHPAGVRSVGVRQQRRQRRGARGADRRRLDRADDSAVPGELARHLDHCRHHPALDPDLADCAVGPGTDHQHHDLGRTCAGGGHSGGRRHGRHRKHQPSPRGRHRKARGDSAGFRADRRADPGLDLVHLHRVHSDVPVVRGGALSVRAPGGGGGLRHAGLVLLLTDLDSDAGDVFAAQRRAALCRRRQTARGPSCVFSAASSAASRSFATSTADGWSEDWRGPVSWS